MTELRLEFEAFGCRSLVVVDTEESGLSLDWVPRWLAETESRLSRFLPNSELSQLNARAGEWVPVSLPLWNAINTALAMAQATEGLITPTVLPALLRFGYDRDFREGLDRPQAELAPPSPVAGYQDIEIDSVRQAVRLPVGAGIDLGGSAKGATAERLVGLFSGYPVLVDLGGDIAVRGPRLNEGPWAVETEPVPDGQPRLILVDRGGIATSGCDWRRWTVGGRACHHLIDPRTGEPAATDLLRATVVATSVVWAEAAAKVALLLGREQALAFIEDHSDLAALLIDQRGQAWPSSRFDALCWTGAGLSE